MKPVKQNKFGKQGNCMQAAIASILELPLEWAPEYGMDEGWFMKLNEWLKPLSLAYVEVETGSPICAPPGVWCILVGPSHRDLMHACVGQVGDGFLKVNHDPHPSDGGLKEIRSVGWFVSLTPGDLIRGKEAFAGHIASTFLSQGV